MISRIRSLLLRIAVAFATAFLASATAQAQGVELSGTAKVEREVDVNGAITVQLVEPTSVVPGDRLVFATTYTNTGSEPAEDVVITNSLSNVIAFVEAADNEISRVSVDAGKTWGKLDELTVRDDAGEVRPAVRDDVTHVRWTLPTVAPGTSGTVSYRGTVR